MNQNELNVVSFEYKWEVPMEPFENFKERRIFGIDNTKGSPFGATVGSNSPFGLSLGATGGSNNTFGRNSIFGAAPLVSNTLGRANSLGDITIESPPFPSGSIQQWNIQLIKPHSPSLKIIPRRMDYLCAKFIFFYEDAFLGSAYCYNGVTSIQNEVPLVDFPPLSITTACIFKIVCKASVVVETLEVPSTKSLIKMSENFETLYNNKQDSGDIIFCVGESNIKAHKLILIARSEVFAVMFKNDSKESQTGSISITDRDEEVIEEMLRYMYTGKVPKLDSLSDKLLDCAEQYLMDELKEICLKYLETNITIEKAANTLKLADKFGSEKLKRHAIKYIIQNPRGVTETQAWKDMIPTHGHLIEEAFRELALGPPTNICQTKQII